MKVRRLRLLKTAIAEVAQLAHFQPGKGFIIDCDASNTGLGVVLAHKDKQGRDVPTAFAIRLLQDTGSRWRTTELEALAAVWALKTFCE